MNNKPLLVTGITPTGDLTIGNYLGAIKPLLKYQEKCNLIFFAANLHSITQISGDNPLRFTSKELREKTYKIIAIYDACGLDMKKNISFIQSDISYHSELAYILTCCTTIGQLERMTQYKDKSRNNTKVSSIPAGLLIYPGLMAADILLYNPDYVPVGKDQVQHIELCRDIADFFNKNYGKIFKLPKPLIDKNFFKIKSLVDPKLKMSKSSNNPMSYISLFDNPENIREKIMKAKTDSENKIYYDEKNKPGISNLLTIFSGVCDRPIKSIVKEYENYDYKKFKQDLIIKLNIFLKNIQDKYNISYNKKYLDNILSQGKKRAIKIAKTQYDNVLLKMGL